MNILITGVSKGLGFQTAKLLLKNGWSVYGISRSKSEDLCELLELYPDNIKWLGYDLADAENIRQVVFKDWIGFNTPIHGFVNNAAMAYDDIVTNINIEPLEEMYKVNVFSPMLLTKFTIRQIM